MSVMKNTFSNRIIIVAEQINLPNVEDLERSQGLKLSFVVSNDHQLHLRLEYFFVCYCIVESEVSRHDHEGQ
jgi:hypothetical protein